MRHTTSLLLLGSLLVAPFAAHAQDVPPPAPAVVPAPPVLQPQYYPPYPPYPPDAMRWAPPEPQVRLKSGRWMRLRDAESSARARVGAGVTLVILGTIFQSVAIAAGSLAGNSMNSDCVHLDNCTALTSTITVGVAGAVMASIGIPTLVSGALLKRELAHYQPSFALAPSSSGASVAAGFHF